MLNRVQHATFSFDLRDISIALVILNLGLMKIRLVSGSRTFRLKKIPKPLNIFSALLYLP
jgi:hypothetical protein